MRKYIMIFIIITFVCSIFSGMVFAEKESWPSKISIGAGPHGSGFYMGSSTLAKIINEKFKGLVAGTVEVTGAARHNLKLIQAGQIEIGMSTPDAAWEAWYGKGFAEGEDPYNKVRGMLPGWAGVFQMTTLAKSNINNIKDFDGKPFSCGSKGSSAEAVSRRIFEVFGIKPKLMNLPGADSVRAVRDGLVAGCTNGWPNPAVMQLDITHEVKIVTLDEEQSKKFAEAYPQYIWGMVIPKGTYKLHKEDLTNVCLYNSFYCSKDLPEDMVYEILKVYFQNEKIVEEMWPRMVNGSKIDNIKYLNIPLHPGAVRYAREHGMEVPEDLIPPEMK